MRLRILTIVMMWTLLPGAALAQGRPVVDSLRWLAGCWRMEDATTVVEECWMAPAGGGMLGVGRTVVDGIQREHELLRILKSDDGGIELLAQPSGQPPARFALTQIGPHSCLFENPAHDFPRSIGYRLDEAGNLLAWIEGDLHGRVERIEFPYRPSQRTIPCADDMGKGR